MRDKYLEDCLDALIEMKEEAISDEEDDAIDSQISDFIKKVQVTGMMW